MTQYARAHDIDSWLRDPRIAARGFAHRWQSSVAAGNGEDAFIALIDQYLCPDCDVLDLGCGQTSPERSVSQSIVRRGGHT